MATMIISVMINKHAVKSVSKIKSCMKFQGGMRGVVWTDVLQACIMVLGLFVVIIKGSNEVGGVLNVLVTARDGKRLTLFE